MPTISLRLTDEERDLLERWAYDGKRSLQKEIIWRLFGNAEIYTGPAEMIPPPPVTKREAYPHFKPDPKK